MSVPPLRLITLDLDDTLWPCRPVIEGAERALHDWLRAVAPRLAAAHDIAALRRHRQRLAARLPHRAHDLGEIRLRSLRLLLARHGYRVGLAEAGLRLFLDHRNRVTPYPDVIPALRALGRHYRLISLTNGNAEVQATPLHGLFAHSLNAVDVGAAKPDPALFVRALALAGCRPEEALHLGDDPARDVAAARACGLRAAWIDRDLRPWPEGLAPPAWRATDLAEVVDRLVP
ncbi:HAD family hydrolase [Marichromatium bheemlicum]|uniref:HAD family hydrolase n=1 Tax=Marichromatium bheemlicum TaxID=365339 RepID=A0ABX1I7J8_9GAMM|nr:HAD family hydrolase [Marichromatium bheemlicum]NKN33136.1 HAD family hydrolase [Marichromatium bheemlicum]